MLSLGGSYLSSISRSTICWLRTWCKTMTPLRSGSQILIIIRYYNLTFTTSTFRIRCIIAPHTHTAVSIFAEYSHTWLGKCLKITYSHLQIALLLRMLLVGAYSSTGTAYIKYTNFSEYSRDVFRKLQMCAHFDHGSLLIFYSHVYIEAAVTRRRTTCSLRTWRKTVDIRCAHDQ